MRTAVQQAERPVRDAGQDAAPPDAALVAAARAGDKAAWAALYERFAPVVHGVLLCRVGRADADDLTQEVFIRAMQRLSDVRDGAAVGGWLIAIARNAATSSVRTRSPVSTAGFDVQAREDPRDTESTDEAKRALAAIRSLPEAYRETLMLRLVEGLTGPQIAERTGLTHGSVRVNLHRGMQLLRQKLSGGVEP